MNDQLTTIGASSREVVSFGPFRLIASERVLLRDGTPVELGGRGLETLIALVSRANEVIGKRELLSQVWPDVRVEEGSLRFHIANLRKALGDGVDGARYIATLAGRGYCFVAPIERTTAREAMQPAASSQAIHANLPSPLSRMVGREREVLLISNQLRAQRFVTVAGAGGVGKTTVAVAVGHSLLEAFAGAVIFIDLGALSEPTLVASTLATMLGLSVQGNDATPGLVAYLQDKRVLLIFDTCEHVIDAVADVTSRVFAGAPQVHLLATSREALRVEGEYVCKLEPLAYPPADPNLTADGALTFPATQLFVERVRASGAQLEFNDSEAAIVASICRKLDGVALAIELAAGRVKTYGLQRTADLLDERLTLLWPGQRTAAPRHRTLQATLEWSYGLLSPAERSVLRRLAVFVGYFTFEAALQVSACMDVDQSQAFVAIESLIDKSMIAVQPLGAMMRYRLLDTTRAYALQVDATEEELARLAARHATYYRQWLDEIGPEWSGLSNAAERAPHLAALGNVRSALQWCFGTDGNSDIGVALAAAAAPVLLSMSLLTECHHWTERALQSLNDATRGGVDEMRLQAGLGMSLMFTRGNGDAARVAFERSLAIAEERGDVVNQMLLLGPLHMFHFRTGEFSTSLDYARRAAAAAGKLGDADAIALAHCLTGVSLHSMGELAAARRELAATLEYDSGSHRGRTLHLGFDYRNWASMALARTLWLQGYPAQAIERVNEAIRDAELMDHSVTLTIILHWAAAVDLWVGDLEAAERHIDWFLSRAETHSLGPYLAVGSGLKGALAIRRGDFANGVELVENALRKLHAARYELVTTAFNLSLAEGLDSMGRTGAALQAIDATIESVAAHGDRAFMPELLRMKSRLLSRCGHEPSEIEACLRRSLEWCQAQGSRSWELRAATDLAALLIAQGKASAAASLLEPVYAQFVDGLETADKRAAQRLLSSLRPSPTKVSIDTLG